MAYIQLNYYSDALSKIVPVHLIIPNDVQENEKEEVYYARTMKVLYLLHGITGNCTDWICGTNIQTLCKRYHIAVVCPSGDNSFYVDRPLTGGKYGTFVGWELVDYCRKTFGFSDKKRDTFIGGFSMGGYGAIRNGLKYNKTFGKIMAFSSALIIRDLMEKGMEYEDGITNAQYREDIFGPLDQLEKSDKNPEHLIKTLVDQNESIPELYLTCGTEDGLIRNNRQFIEFLKAYDVKYTYLETSGEHNWDYWNSVLEPAIAWLVKE